MPTNLSVESLLTQNPDLLTPPKIMSSPEALGHSVVSRAVSIAEAAVNEDQTSFENQSKINAYDLDGVRDIFEISDKETKSRIAGKLLSENQPEWLTNTLGEAATDPGLFAEAIGQKDLNGEYQINDQTLTNILEWHNAVETEKQQRFEAETIAPMRQAYIGRLESAIAAGWIPEDTLDDERRSLIMKTPVFLDDDIGLDRMFHGYSGKAEAYAKPRSDKSVIVFRSNKTEKSKANIESTFTHEMTHVITGFTPDSTRDFSAEPTEDKKGTYGIERVVGDNLVGKALNEAVTEHFAQALLSGDIDKIRPLKGSYKAERYLLKALCKRGETPIDPRLFATAMFSGDLSEAVQYSSPFADKSQVEESAVIELRTSLEKAFPKVDIIDLMKQQLTEPGIIGAIAVRQTRKLVRQL